MERNKHSKEQDEEIKISKQNRPLLHRQSQQSNEIPYKQLFTMQVEITRSSFLKKMSALVHQRAQTIYTTQTIKTNH